MPNYADAGMTTQAFICDYYHLTPCTKAKKQFEKCYNKKYESTLKKIIPKIFGEIGCEPTKCVTMVDGELTNFILGEKNEDGSSKTLKVVTAKDLVVVPGIGQCGIEEFNAAFSDVVGCDWGSLTMIEKKRVVIKKIHKMLPIYLEFMYSSDYIVWIPNLRLCLQKKKGARKRKTEQRTYYELLKTDFKREELCLDKEKICFTRDLRPGIREWVECNTLKYENYPIAVIQTHKNRSQLKFRFKAEYFKRFTEEIVQKKCNTETLGMSAEYAFCQQYKLKLAKSDECDLKQRSNAAFVKMLLPVVAEIQDKRYIPDVKEHTGQRRGPGGWKDPHDFILDSNKTMSLKTNKSDCLVCPPDIGQPGVKRCTEWLKEELNVLSNRFKDKHGIEMNDILSGKRRSASDGYKNDLRIEFKNAVLTSLKAMLAIYTEKLFGSDYLVWIKVKNRVQSCFILQGIGKKCIDWKKSLLHLSREEISDDPQNGWNVSNEVYYNNLRIGSFMVHRTRTTFLFRFDLESLVGILNSEYGEKVIKVR